MELKTIQDIERLPSVLSGEEVSHYMVELVEIIERDDIEVLIAGDAINDFISYLGEGEELDQNASLAIFKWTEATYDSSNKEIVCIATFNLANSNCEEAISFIKSRVANPSNDYEYSEFKETADELGIKT